MDSIYPFVKLPEYPFVICTVCQHGCIAKEVETHLRRHHKEIEKKARSKVIQNIKLMPGIIHTQEVLREYTLPICVEKPIPHIRPPEADGMRCNDCPHPYITRQKQDIQKHYRDIHGWVNDWKNADNFKKKSQEDRIVPWTANVYCQRFFLSRAGSRWFEVKDPNIESANVERGPEVMEWVKQCHDHQDHCFKEAENNALVAKVDQKLEANAWLGRVGWSVHLAGLEPDKLRAMARPVEDDEGVLQEICNSLNRAIESAWDICHPSIVGLSVLFEINRREAQTKPNQPFDVRMEEDSWQRYKDVWQKIICILYRSQQQEEDTQLPYQFTSKQEDIWNRFTKIAKARFEKSQGNPINESIAKLSNVSFDRQCLEFVMALLDHQIPEDEYKNAIISSLAVLGIRDDGGWHSPSDYTPILSAVIKIARMLAVSWAYWQREDEVEIAIKEKNIEERLACESVTGMFPRVRAMVQKFMTRIGDGRLEQPGPMDWILETRTYGMHIKFNTTASGSIDWHNDQVQYKRVKFTMGQLSEMMHGVVAEARELLIDLAMVKEDGLEALPAISWGELEDDNSEDQVGYSFLQDTRNKWLDRGKGWILGRIGQSKVLQKEWITNIQGSDHPYKKKTVQNFSKKVERFREKLWLLIHMVSGQPARATEVLTLRFRNTSNGGARNIFINKGQVCFVTAYHKNFQQSGQAKIIHRFMPRVVGELLVWYLWLVLPFWQEVQGMIKGEGRVSSFLWGEEIVHASQDIVGKEMSSHRLVQGSFTTRLGSESIETLAEWRNWFEERSWTSDRVRRVMQQHSERLMGSKLNISTWRHVAIAISNRYLGSKYTCSIGEDEEGIEDEPSDLQAGHGTNTAGMVYARELQQGLGGTALMREKFREVSNKWHRFFGFDIEENEMRTGQKRKRDEFESGREKARFERLQRLRQANIGGQLEQMLGQGVEFRGQQSHVIQAIITGKTPIIQIASTGEGKSLSFMLPAYCSPEGTTIVIVPLVALQDEMLLRCQKLRIPAHIWKSRQSNPLASIIFVTPETAVTEGFRGFVNRLQNRGVLDRVVVDECHTLLDGSPKFRPKLKEIGQTIRGWGVQRVFLTATLRPTEMDDFYRIAEIDPMQKVIFRSKTTRPNIQYKVFCIQGGNVDLKVQRFVQEWLVKNIEGKVIVYTGSIDRTKKVGEMLGCNTYYNRVDTAKGKMERLKTWICSERVIVATNALGMGIDVPDIRLVVHAWMPKRIRDYVQESGRGGRDGKASQAVVICGPVKKDNRGDRQGKGRNNDKAEEREDETIEYVVKEQCRRIVLDQCMDGRTDREGCEEGEEKCDVCKGDSKCEEIDDIVDEEPRMVFEREKKEMQFQAWQYTKRAMEEAAIADELEMFLDEWSDCCVLCHMGDQLDTHLMRECPYQSTPKYSEMVDYTGRMELEMFKKRRLEKYSGCFGCGLPYKICNGWRSVDGDGGKYVKVQGQACQYSGLLIRFYGAAISLFKGQVKNISGKDVDSEEFFQWAGQRVAKWGGMETNEMCRGFVAMCKWVADDSS